MRDIFIIAKDKTGVTDSEIESVLREVLKGPGIQLKKILLLPPDLTRMHSGAGKITAMIYSMLKDSVQVDVMPALGTHEPMTKEEAEVFFEGAVPYDKIIPHRWRDDVIKIGEVPSDFVRDFSEVLFNEAMTVEVNKRILDKSYDLILSIGQVVPHEVVGMANYSKNVLVGCGGKDTINKSHMLGAVYGMERMMGKDHSPVRKVFDYAQKHYLDRLPISYILTVTTVSDDNVIIEGIFAGSRRMFEKAVELSRQKNLNMMDKP